MLPCAAHQEQQVQERHVVQVAGEQAAHRHLEQVARDVGADPRTLEPPGDRARVPLRGALRRPRRVERDLLRHPIELHLRQRDRDDGERADLRDEAGVAADAVVVDEEVRALHPRLVGRHAHLRREAEDRVVLRRRATRHRGRPANRRRAAASRPDRRRGRAPRARRPILPAWTSRRAAVSPAYPAPTTHTSASMRSGIGCDVTSRSRSVGCSG